MQFPCILDVGTAENVLHAGGIAGDLRSHLDLDGYCCLGFEVEADPDSGPGDLWIHSGDYGEPEHVIAFVLRCAEAFDLSGLWGFCWALSCSKPRLGTFGGGAQLIDLGQRMSVAWTDHQYWLDEHLGPRNHRSCGRGAVRCGCGSRAMIRRILDVCSDHLPPDTWRWLDAQFVDNEFRDPRNGVAAELAGGRTRCGWVTYVPEDPINDIPADLARVLREGSKHGTE